MRHGKERPRRAPRSGRVRGVSEVSGRVREVERLLQVVTVLRAGDGYPVARRVLLERIPEYRQSGADPESVKRMMANDRRRLAEIGFQVEDVAGEGDTSAFVLRDTAWRLPLDLDAREQNLLRWVMAAAGAVAAEGSPTTAPDDLSGLLGHTPRSFDLVQTAIATRRLLVIERDGRETTFAPGRLANRQGRWFVVGRYDGEALLKAPRIDRLQLVALGAPMTDPPVVDDPDLYLDPTAWEAHEWRAATIRCRTADRPAVASWFARAEVTDHEDGTTTFALPYRNEGNLVTRVIGLAGAAWVEGPDSAVQAVRRQVLAVVGER